MHNEQVLGQTVTYGVMAPNHDPARMLLAPESGPPEPGSCALVGPSRSGKTSFLASLATAFEHERRSDWTRFVPGARFVDTRGGDEAAMNGEPVATSSARTLAGWSTHSFQLGVGSGASESVTQPEEMELSVLDTPGAFFEALVTGTSGGSDEQTVRDLVRAVRNARCLVLCVDANKATPLDLAPVIDGLLGDGETRLIRIGATAWPGSEPPWQRAARLELPFERVLILLTHVESLCVSAAETLARSLADWPSANPAELRTFHAYASLDAWRVAELLDAPQLLRQSVAGVDALQASLKPGAHLTVSVVAAQGFPPAPGEGAEAPPTERHRWRPEDELALRRRPPDRTGAPFGVWPALLFMATGRVTPPLTLVAGDGGVDQRWPR